jgi:hypothetical protein
LCFGRAANTMHLVNDNIIEHFHFGVWNRFRDAFYPYFGLEGKNWLLGISYDLFDTNINKFFNSVQSMEFSLAWHLNSVKRTGADQQIL